ncbi:MAG: hypothetical protein WA061_06530 [Microgenomates group bacterium]
MMSLLNPRVRIGIVLIASFFISGFVMKYTQESPSEAAPQIQIQTIASDFSQSFANSGSNILTALQSFKIPSLVSFVSPSQQEQPIEQPVEPTPVDWETNPTEPPEIPTSTPIVLPTNGPIPTHTSLPTIKPTIRITQPPQPTKAPKPTKVPKPTEVVYPPINDDVRPGTSIEEIMKDVEKRACVPYKLLMAIRTLEAGNWFKNMSATTTKMYNTYGWWKTSDKGTVCSGLGYYTQSGTIPPDSAGAGETCSSKIGLQTYDLKIMGIMQISEQEEQVTRKYTIKTLPKNIDRRVLFDNILIFGIATKNRAGKFPQPSCSDWPQETVKEVARIHASGSSGSCNYTYSQNGKSGNYCNEVWDLYKSF